MQCYMAVALPPLRALAALKIPSAVSRADSSISAEPAPLHVNPCALDDLFLPLCFFSRFLTRSVSADC